MKSREHIVTNGRAVFYACLWEDLRNAALDCGWALGLHGSLSSDMDIMAMPWVENAKSVDEMIESLESCMTKPDERIFKTTKTTAKPNNRIVYTIHIFSDFYLDINIINPVGLEDDGDDEVLGSCFKWSTEYFHVDNCFTMNDYLDNHLPQDANIVFTDGSYAEITIGERKYALDAKGDGDSYHHIVNIMQLYN